MAEKWVSPNQQRKLARVPERKEKDAYELLMEAERNQRVGNATPIEREVYDILGMEPGLDRAGLLPIAGSKSQGNLQFAAPGFIYDLAKAAVTPGAVAKGKPVSNEDVVNVALNTMGGGLAVSSPVEGAIAGMAVKNKGGNWLKDSVEKHTQWLKAQPSDEAILGIEADKALFDEFESYIGAPVTERYYGPDDLDLLEDLNYFLETKHPDLYSNLTPPHAKAVNAWVDTKLNKYIKNELGTPEDPMLALADSNKRTHLELHDEPEPYDDFEYVTGPTVKLRRAEAGFPAEGYATTPRGEDWEQMADLSLFGKKPEFYLGSSRFGSNSILREQNPWLETIDPESRVFQAQPSLANNLRLPHLIDELKNATDPNTTLPDNLRIDPKKLDRMTVPQISEKVGEINAWRAEEAAKAERAGMLTNLQATSRLEAPDFNLSFVDKPGGKWVDIPDTSKDGMPICTSIGRAGGWCTMGESAAADYGSGEGRLTVLLDAEGRPHVQAHITTMAFEPYAQELYARKPFIEELKPVGNSLDSSRAKEYTRRDPQYRKKVTQSVLDFLNAGEWEQVRDLDYYGIVDTVAEGGSRPFPGPRFVAQDQWEAFIKPQPERRAKGGMINAPTETPANYSKGRWRLI